MSQNVSSKKISGAEAGMPRSRNVRKLSAFVRPAKKLSASSGTETGGAMATALRGHVNVHPPNMPAQSGGHGAQPDFHFRFTNSETNMLTIHRTRRETFPLTFCFTFSLAFSLIHILFHSLTHSLTYSFTQLLTFLTIFLKASGACRKRMQYWRLRQPERFHERPENQKKSISHGDASTPLY
jgi:hypothetical protein